MAIKTPSAPYTKRLTTARDWLKRKRPMLFAELSSGDEQDTPVEELLPDERSENLPEQVIDQKETKRLIREIIEELPEDQRAAIGMFYYEEMSVKEIAAAMGVSESAVKSRLLYGRNKIEKKVLELEKQGTKLYNLAPIPFLLLLFRSQEVHAAEASEETETLEEADPIDEALEQYRTIIGQADSYDYGSSAEADMSWLEFAGYRYALVQMQTAFPVPTLLLGKEIMDTELNVSSTHALVFQYDPDTKTIHQSTETIVDGGIRGGLSVSADGNGILSTGWSSGTGEGSVTRITLDGDSLNRNIIWSGQIFEKPDSIASVAIEWHEIGDLSALDNWTAPDLSEAALSEPVNEDMLPTDGDRIVLTGTVGTYDYDEIVVLQRQPDPDAAYYSEASWERIRNTTYRVIVLDTPQSMNLHSGGGDYYSVHEALMINLEYADGIEVIYVNNINKGKATVIIKGIDTDTCAYADCKTATFSIVACSFSLN